MRSHWKGRKGRTGVRGGGGDERGVGRDAVKERMRVGKKGEDRV